MGKAASAEPHRIGSRLSPGRLPFEQGRAASRHRRLRRLVARKLSPFMRALALLFAALALATPAAAETIANPIAAFSGLDKITGRITNFDVYIDETVQFGALQLTPRACYTR